MNNWVQVRVPFIVDGPTIDDHAFTVLDELYELTGIKDPDVFVDLGERRVTIELFSVGESLIDAVNTGIAAMRSAIHAAGGATHGWEDRFAGLHDPTLFPKDTPLTEWEATETTFSPA